MIIFDLFNRLRRADKTGDAPRETLAVPLLPLNAVLFPGGVLPLHISSDAYRKLTADGEKENFLLGICLQRQGGKHASGETDSLLPPVHRIGVVARIDSGNPTEAASAKNIVALTLHGKQRFRLLKLLNSEANVGVNATNAADMENGSLRGQIELIAEPAHTVIPDNLRGLIPILAQIIADLGAARMPPPHDYENAAWLGYRLCETMPIQPLARQKLLELDDPISRLEIVYRYLLQRGLIKA